MNSNKNYPTVCFTRKAYDSIRSTVGSKPAESGCLLLGYEEELNKDRLIVRDIIFDKMAHATSATYTLNTEYLNPLIRKAFKERNLAVIGIEHSHPYGCNYPSSFDVVYFSNMLKKMPRKYLIIPIAFTDPDGGFKQFVYIMDSPKSMPIPVSYVILDEMTPIASVQNDIEYSTIINEVSAQNVATHSDLCERHSKAICMEPVYKRLKTNPFSSAPRFGFAGGILRR